MNKTGDDIIEKAADRRENLVEVLRTRETKYQRYRVKLVKEHLSGDTERTNNDLWFTSHQAGSIHTLPISQVPSLVFSTEDNLLYKDDPWTILAGYLDDESWLFSRPSLSPFTSTRAMIVPSVPE